jgi:hypothetical protein
MQVFENKVLGKIFGREEFLLYTGMNFVGFKDHVVF